MVDLAYVAPATGSAGTVVQNRVIARFATAPLRFEGIAQFDVPPDVLFATVSDTHKLLTWLPMIRNVAMDNSQCEIGDQLGPGSVRHCDFKRMGRVDEHIVWWDPPYGYGFRFEKKNKAMMPTENHVTALLVASDGKAGSILTFRTYFDWSPGPMRYFAIHMMRMMLNAAFRNMRREMGGRGGRFRRVA